jgi:4-methyl-5(b-hydroxyethyl)-thiazole monophosphate biosynthesis
MAKIAVFLINGVEDMEAVTTVDLVRRGKVEVDVVSLEPSLMIEASTGIGIKCDKLFSEIHPDDYDLFAIPGGTLSYLDHKPFLELLTKAGQRGKPRIAALCIAPIVLSELGLLEGKRASSYPNAEKRLKGATVVKDAVVTDGNVTTSRGPGTAPLFALEILRVVAGQEVADSVREGVLIKDIKVFP